MLNSLCLISQLQRIPLSPLTQLYAFPVLTHSPSVLSSSSAQTSPPALQQQLAQLWNKYVEQARLELLSRASSADAAAYALAASLQLAEYAVALCGHYGDAAPLELRLHPPALAAELGRKLGQAAAELVRVLREPTVTSADRSTLKHCATLLRLAELLSRRASSHRALLDACEVSAHVTSMALQAHIRLADAAAAPTPLDGSVVPLLQLLLWSASLYIERLFVPGAAWLSSSNFGSSSSLAAAEPSLATELQRAEAVIVRLMQAANEQQEERDQLDRMLMLLNAWMRCSGADKRVNECGVNNTSLTLTFILSLSVCLSSV